MEYYGPYGKKVRIHRDDTYKAFEVAQACGLSYVSFDSGSAFEPAVMTVWKEWELVKSLLDDDNITYFID